MFPRINSRMSTSPLYNSTVSLARKHSRMSLLAAGAAAAGMVGVAGASIGSTHVAHAMDNVVTTANTTQGSSNHSNTSALDEVLGVGHASQPAKQQPAASQAARPQAAAVVRAPAKAVPAKAVPAKAAPAKAAPAKAAPAKPAAAATPAAPAHAALARTKAAPHKAPQPTGPTKPYLVYDSVTPGTLPSDQAAAVYATGAYAASSSQVAGHHSVLWIDANGSDPNANVLDVEPGDATPAGAATWVQAHMKAQPHSEAIIYTMRSDWSAVQDAVGGLPSWEQSHVRYWIADPTGYAHVVPGSSATQWYWGSNYDISTANPNFQQ